MSEVVSNLIPRNSPCPCGSGRRYKDCHGAIGAGSGTSRTTPPHAGAASPHGRTTPSYRAPDAEWAHLSESARAQCSALMQRALTYQIAGHLDEAAASYAEVLAQAPSTHDALHMAGVVEYSRGNLDRAERLIIAAMALRPSYQAIEHNLQLVHDAKFAALVLSSEDLCERALPILAECTLARGKLEGRSASTPAARSFESAIHLIGRPDASDGERRLRAIAELLAAHDPTVWSVDDGWVDCTNARRTQRVDAATGRVPNGGTHLYVGVDYDCSSWIDRADADRVIVFCGSAAPSLYIDQLRALARDGSRPVELVFPSHAMAARFGRGHHVLPPSFEIDRRTSPAFVDDSIITAIGGHTRWSVGIIGQECVSVAEPDDVEFLRLLAATASLRIYDPGRLRFSLGSDPRVQFISRQPNDIAAFVKTIRCFVHRVTAWWAEPAHEGLFAAMVAGVPVLCPASSIFAEYIDDGVDGMLYVGEQDCAAKVAELMKASARAAEMGKAARAKALQLFDPHRLSGHYAALVGGHRVEAGIGASSFAGLELTR